VVKKKPLQSPTGLITVLMHWESMINEAKHGANAVFLYSRLPTNGMTDD